MTFEEFDQTMGAGWRALAKAGDYAGAARAIEAYREENALTLEDWQIETLHFHAAQMHAFAGATEEALRHLPFTRKTDEGDDPLIRWNDYVDATEAFLRGDRAALTAARDRIAAGRPMEDGRIANLHVVERLVAHFGKPYFEAY